MMAATAFVCDFGRCVLSATARHKTVHREGLNIENLMIVVMYPWCAQHRLSHSDAYTA